MKIRLAILSLFVTCLLLCWTPTLAAGVEPPTGFTATDGGANTVSLSWALGTGATNTTIVCKRASIPADRTDGETIYIGDGTSYDHSGLALETTKYYYAAWGWEAVGGYSATAAETSAGGEGVESIATGLTDLSADLLFITMLAFSLTIVGIALWQKKLLLYLVAIVTLVLCAAEVQATSITLAIPLFILALYLAFWAMYSVLRRD